MRVHPLPFGAQRLEALRFEKHESLQHTAGERFDQPVRFHRNQALERGDRPPQPRRKRGVMPAIDADADDGEDAAALAARLHQDAAELGLAYDQIVRPL